MIEEERQKKKGVCEGERNNYEDYVCLIVMTKTDKVKAASLEKTSVAHRLSMWSVDYRDNQFNETTPGSCTHSTGNSYSLDYVY